VVFEYRYKVNNITNTIVGKRTSQCLLAVLQLASQISEKKNIAHN